MKLPVSLYFTPEWWDRHYHGRCPRPETAAREHLESMYLGRQRFLFEQFGAYGVGEEKPKLGPGQIATVIRYGFDLVPLLLGVRLEHRDAWGFYPQPVPLADAARRRPVDIAAHPEGQWIREERDRMVARYGGASQCIDMGSVTNNAFRILGNELYTALLSDADDCRRLFEVIIETQFHLYRFLRELFPPMDPVPISNCNVHLMGPATYRKMVLPFDARQNRFAERLAGVKPRAALHHCDVPVDNFLEAYAVLPGLASLQASFLSDLAAAKTALPDCAFSALVSPVAMMWETAAFEEQIRRAIPAGVADLALWNIDPAVDLDRLRDILDIIRSACVAAGRPAVFSAQPLCWDEIEWAHGRYCR